MPIASRGARAARRHAAALAALARASRASEPARFTRNFARRLFAVLPRRVRLGCYGVNGGRAGKPFCVTVDLYGRAKDLGGLVDGEPLAAGHVLRVVTTGGGGGDPLERERELVQRDVIEGKVSAAAARDEYGVALVPGEANARSTAPAPRGSGRRCARRAGGRCQ